MPNSPLIGMSMLAVVPPLESTRTGLRRSPSSAGCRTRNSRSWGPLRLSPHTRISVGPASSQASRLRTIRTPATSKRRRGVYVHLASEAALADNQVRRDFAEQDECVAAQTTARFPVGFEGTLGQEADLTCWNALSRRLGRVQVALESARIAVKHENSKRVGKEVERLPARWRRVAAWPPPPDFRWPRQRKCQPTPAAQRLDPLANGHLQPFRASRKRNPQVAISEFEAGFWIRGSACLR